MGNAEVIAILTRAFLPLRCVAKLIRNDSRVEFSVYEGDACRMFGAYPAVDLRRQYALEEVILQTRDRLTAIGFVLKPWRMPTMGR